MLPPSSLPVWQPVWRQAWAVCLTLPEGVLPVQLHLLFVCRDKKLASGALGSSQSSVIARCPR